MSSTILSNVTIQGTLTTVGTLGQTTYAPVDLGVNSLSLATGNLTSLITTTSSAPSGFAAAGEGALVFPGTANAYISFGTTGQPFSNSNIYAFGDFVVEAWVNPASLANSPVLLTIGDGVTNSYWAMQLNSSGNIIIYSLLNSVPSSVVTGGSVSSSTWQHVAMIHQSATKRFQLYINGQPQTVSVVGGGFSTSGTVASYTTGIIPVSGQATVLGQSLPANTYNGSLTNLRIVTGSGAAQIYNNNAFTPSTSPLFPASNTAGGSLTTRLLVRVPQTPGKVQMNKITGAQLNNPSGVGAFPPAPMTGYLTDLTGLSPYGQGKYVASASSEATAAWYAFDKTVGSGSTSYWSSAGSTYNSGTGFVSSSVVTVDVNGNPYAGEWLQVQMPVSIVLSSYSLQARGDSFVQTPVNFWVLGSRDGTNWTLVDSRVAVSWTATSQIIVFNTTSSQSWTFYRLVANRVTTSSLVASTSEWTLNGTIEALNVTSDGRLGLGVVNPTRALEVAGDVVCGGTLSAGNPLMFRNALYNGDMRIAQRGTSFVGVAGFGYTLDRWYGTYYGAVSAYYTISQIQSGLANFSNALQLQQTSTNVMNAFLTQSLETRDVVRFQGQPVTLSFWYRIPTSFTGSWNASLLSNVSVDTRVSDPGVTYTILGSLTLTNQTSWTYANFSAFVPTTTQSLSVMFLTTGSTVNGAQFQLTGVQLEKGLVATPFETRPFATELALCQRYYYRVGGDATFQVFGLGSFIGSTTQAQVFIPFPVTMRVGATGANFSNSAVTTFWFGAGSGATCTAVIQVGNAESRVGNQVAFTTSSAVTAGTGCIIEAANTTSAFLAFNAEL